MSPNNSGPQTIWAFWELLLNVIRRCFILLFGLLLAWFFLPLGYSRAPNVSWESFQGVLFILCGIGGIYMTSLVFLAVILIILSIAMIWGAIRFYRRWIQRSACRPPPVNVNLQWQRGGVSDAAFSGASRRRFPAVNPALRSLQSITRRLGVLLLVVGIVIVLATMIKPEAPYITEISSQIHLMLTFVEEKKPIPEGVALAMVGSSLFGLLVLAQRNQFYAILSLKKVSFLNILLAAAGIWGLIQLTGSYCVTMGYALSICLLWMYRLLEDLRRIQMCVQEEKLSGKLQGEVAKASRWVDQLHSRSDCPLPALNRSSIERRVTHGLRWAEGTDVLIRRHFARFLNQVTGRTTPTYAAALCFLTVRRFVTHCCLGGTSEPIFSRPAPIWDDTLSTSHRVPGHSRS